MKKVFITSILIGLILFMLPSFVLATPTATKISAAAPKPTLDLSYSTLKEKSQELLTNGTNPAFDSSELINTAANILTTIGVIIVLAGILITGIMYMFATPEEAAKLKVKIIGLVIAGIIIIGAFSIWKFVGTMLEDIT